MIMAVDPTAIYVYIHHPKCILYLFFPNLQMNTCNILSLPVMGYFLLFFTIGKDHFFGGGGVCVYGGVLS